MDTPKAAEGGGRGWYLASVWACTAGREGPCSSSTPCLASTCPLSQSARTSGAANRTRSANRMNQHTNTSDADLALHPKNTRYHISLPKPARDIFICEVHVLNNGAVYFIHCIEHIFEHVQLTSTIVYYSLLCATSTGRRHHQVKQDDKRLTKSHTFIFLGSASRSARRGCPAHCHLSPRIWVSCFCRYSQYLAVECAIFLGFTQWISDICAAGYSTIFIVFCKCGMGISNFWH